MKKVLFAIASIIVCSLIIVSCKNGKKTEGEAAEEDTTVAEVVLDDDVADFFGSTNDEYLSELELELRKQIEALAERAWDKKEYQRLNTNIDKYIDGFNAKYSFHSLLDGKYCLSMDKEAKGIMASSSCSKSHSRLKEIMEERKNFAEEKTSIGKSVRSNYNTHQKLAGIIGRFSSKQAVSSYTDKYDESFEEQITEEAKRAYNTHKPVCSYLADNLKNPKFDKRRLDYCNKILALLEKTTNADDIPTVRALLMKAYGNSHGDQMSEWNKELEDFDKKCKAAQNAE